MKTPAVSSAHAWLGAALLIATASGAGFGALAWRNISAPPAFPVEIDLADGSHVPSVTEFVAVKPVSWTQPSPQSRGREWIYDTFTPPEIFYHPHSGQFTVRPPSSLAEDETNEAFALELVSVEPDPFRLQLIGYAGEAGNWCGTFEHTVSGEVFIAGSGRRLPRLGLTIKRVEVSTRPVALSRGMTQRQRVATAIVEDERTGRNAVLTQGERQFSGSGSALVAMAGEAAVRKLRAGEAWTLSDVTFRIERVQIAPPAVEVMKESATALPERRTLFPPGEGRGAPEGDVGGES
jgi:hypothetical protein